MASIQIGVLGPVEALVDSTVATLGATKQRAPGLMVQSGAADSMHENAPWNEGSENAWRQNWLMRRRS